jgi:hypothetical protein
MFHITSGKKTSKDILRAVLGPARSEGVPACHGPCLAEEKIHRAISARPDVPPVSREHDPKRHEAREDRASNARPKSHL